MHRCLQVLVVSLVLLLTAGGLARAELWLGSVYNNSQVQAVQQNNAGSPITIYSAPTIVVPSPCWWNPPPGYYDRRYTVGGWHLYCWPFGYERGFEYQ